MRHFDNIKFVGSGEFELLPPAPNVCQQCACDHPVGIPHNLQSLYYQVWFKKTYGRTPTWDDAFEGCSDEIVKNFVEYYKQHHVVIEHSRNLDQ